jgi:serine/threonine protein phosphatase PrpC
VRIEAFGHTDIGRLREWNEDSYLCLDLAPTGAEGIRPLRLLAVADGVGGQAGGERASALAVQTLEEVVRDRAAKSGAAPDYAAILREAAQIANARIFGEAATDPALAGMGTTLVCALADGDRAVVANIGDSRAYHYRDRSLSLITRDHSWAAEQRRTNALSEEDIRRSPFKNMITRSLGYYEKIEADTFDLTLRPGDALLLCTDGLHGAVPEARIRKTVRRRKPPEWVCAKLIHLANEQGGRDNITVIIARFAKADGRRRPSPPDTVRLKAPG